VPEGDVVRRTAQRLHAALAGRELVTSDLRWPSLATADLRGREVLAVVSAGKHLLTRVGGGLTLHSHLRMEGQWRVHRTDDDAAGRRFRQDRGVRAILANAEWTAVGHRLGMLDLVPTDREGDLVGHLGPDVLGPGWDPDEATRRLLAVPGRPVGEALLDQRVLAGVGTFYMAEALFLRGVSPWTPVDEVPDLAALVALVHKVMAANAERVVQTTTGDARKGRQQYVHARSGLPCRRCGTTVRVAMVGTAPQDRTAFYCPHCQPGPAPDAGAPAPAPLGARPSGASRRRGTGDGRARGAYRRS
jgi:endonuclease-8